MQKIIFQIKCEKNYWDYSKPVAIKSAIDEALVKLLASIKIETHWHYKIMQY